MLNEISEIIKNGSDSEILSKNSSPLYKNQFAKDYLNRLAPSTNKYYFEANPSFIFEYSSLSDIQQYPLVMLRDGLVPILSFFLECHKPPASFISKLLIPIAFENYIPKPWRPYCCVYDFEFKSQNISVDTMYVMNWLNSYTFLNDIESTLIRLFNKNSDIKNFVFLIPLRERVVFSDDDDTPLISEFFYKLQEFKDINYSVITNVIGLKNSNISAHSAFTSIDDHKLLVFDDFMSHLLASKKVITRKANIKRNWKLKYELSACHNICIDECSRDIEDDFSSIAYDLKLNGISKNFFDKGFQARVRYLLSKTK